MHALRYLLLGVILFSEPAGAQHYDTTCANSGTRFRVVINKKTPDSWVPCTVETYEHPLGRYTMKWVVEHEETEEFLTCQAVYLQRIQDRLDEKWKCKNTLEWRGQTLR